ncbi:MAG: TIGR04282 family arsenosugar biosynthesis glycosyltransferase, partial [Myxococcota bacterium]
MMITLPPAPRLVVMTKAPQPGRVKTRLIPALGAEGAAAMHTALVSATLDRVRRSGLDVVIAMGGDYQGAFARSLERQGFTVLPQAPGDLGERLKRALTGPGRRLAIGTDCPIFSPRWLADAAERPEPVVLGPAEDGGYWMICVDAPQDALFDDVPWSTEAVLKTTVDRAKAMGLAVHMAPTCYDIDTPLDLKRLLEDPRCPLGVRTVARR